MEAFAPSHIVLNFTGNHLDGPCHGTSWTIILLWKDTGPFRINSMDWIENTFRGTEGSFAKCDKTPPMSLRGEEAAQLSSERIGLRVL